MKKIISKTAKRQRFDIVYPAGTIDTKRLGALLPDEGTKTFMFSLPITISRLLSTGENTFDSDVINFECEAFNRDDARLQLGEALTRLLDSKKKHRG